MKIEVKDLRSNPYRKIDKYPINKEKVQALKNSINETSFWDNIVCRKCDSVYQIAYGHHRLQALKELEIKEVDIPVRDIDDSTMIRIMANENMDEWQSNTAVMLETVLTAKEFLESELAKYETWDKFRIIKSNSTIFDFNEKETFTRAQEQGIGSPTILKFLGANWKQWQIQKALSILKEKNIDLDAVTEFEDLGYADIAKDQLVKHGVKKEDQKEITQNANEILKSERYENIKTGRTERGVPRKEEKFKAAMEEAIIEKDYKSQKENLNKVFPKRKETPDLNEVASKMVVNISSMNITLKEIFANWKDIDSDTRKGLIRNLTRTFEIIKEKKESKEWTPLQLTK